MFIKINEMIAFIHQWLWKGGGENCLNVVNPFYIQIGVLVTQEYRFIKNHQTIYI